MSRIRTIKPELFKHETLFDAELETGLPLRVAFMGLFTQCDREGRFEWRPRQLKTDILPYDDVDFSRVLDALATRGFLVRYACGTRECGCIPTWHKHQIVNNREKVSDIPPPPSENSETIENTTEPDACPTRAPRDTETAKRKGKGNKEGESESTDVLSQNARESEPPDNVVDLGNIPDFLDRRDGPPPTEQKIIWPMDAFDQFWERYPHKVGQGEAKGPFHWIAMEPPMPFEQFLQAVDRYTATKPADQKWVNPVRWIQGERWKDKPGPEPTRQQGREPNSSALRRASVKALGLENGSDGTRRTDNPAQPAGGPFPEQPPRKRLGNCD